MQLIFVLLIYLLVAGSIMYLLLCVDSNDPGILGKLNRLVFQMMPDVLKYNFFFIFLIFQENMAKNFLEKNS